MALLFSILLGCSIREAAAQVQAPQVLTVQEATDYQGNQPVSGRIGQTVTVQGVIVDGPIAVGGNASLADLQDSSGGITLYSTNRKLLEGHVQRGDQVRATGTIQQYKGQTEILVQSLNRLGPGTLPAPRDVLIADLFGTRFLGRLVRVEGKVQFARDFADHRELTLADRSGEIPIFLGSEIFQDPALSKHLADAVPRPWWAL